MYRYSIRYTVYCLYVFPVSNRSDSGAEYYVHFRSLPYYSAFLPWGHSRFCCSGPLRASCAPSAPLKAVLITTFPAKAPQALLKTPLTAASFAADAGTTRRLSSLHLVR